MLQLKIKLLLCAIKAFATTWWNLSKGVKVISMSRPTLKVTFIIHLYFWVTSLWGRPIFMTIISFSFFFIFKWYKRWTSTLCGNSYISYIPPFCNHRSFTTIFPHNWSLETNVTSVLSFPLSLFNESDFSVSQTHIMVSYIQKQSVTRILYL